MARTILIDEGLESEKKKSMLDNSKSLRFGAVHSRGADVFFLILLSGCGSKKIVFETGLHMAIKLQLRTLRRNVVRRHRKVGRGPRGGRFTFRKSEHQARHSQFAHWLSRWPAGLVRDRSGVPAKMSTRENVHLTILRQRILIRRQNSPVKRSRENVHQPRIWTPNALHFAHAVHFAHGVQNLLLTFDCRSDWF